LGSCPADKQERFSALQLTAIIKDLDPNENSFRSFVENEGVTLKPSGASRSVIQIIDYFRYTD
jgi:hypothetical protein